MPNTVQRSNVDQNRNAEVQYLKSSERTYRATEPQSHRANEPTSQHFGGKRESRTNFDEAFVRLHSIAQYDMYDLYDLYDLYDMILEWIRLTELQKGASHWGSISRRQRLKVILPHAFSGNWYEVHGIGISHTHICMYHVACTLAYSYLHLYICPSP